VKFIKDFTDIAFTINKDKEPDNRNLLSGYDSDEKDEFEMHMKHLEYLGKKIDSDEIEPDPDASFGIPLLWEII
jgi:hypothetical protein